MQYQLNTGKTVTWFTQDYQQRVTAITYPISNAIEGSEEVVTYAGTTLYPGEARELQIRQWTGRAESPTLLCADSSNQGRISHLSGT